MAINGDWAIETQVETNSLAESPQHLFSSLPNFDSLVTAAFIMATTHNRDRGGVFSKEQVYSSLIITINYHIYTFL